MHRPTLTSAESMSLNALEREPKDTLECSSSRQKPGAFTRPLSQLNVRTLCGIRWLASV